MAYQMTATTSQIVLQQLGRGTAARARIGGTWIIEDWAEDISDTGTAVPEQMRRD